MSNTYAHNEFNRLDDGGRTVEYHSNTVVQQILAYVDYQVGTEFASVTVFYPATMTSRCYGPRPADKAEAIAARHLSVLGYTEAAVEDLLHSGDLPKKPALTGKIDPPVNIHNFTFGIAGGAKYQMRCANHHDAIYVSKNPWQRSIFAVDESKICGCSSADLEVIWAPDDAH